jgi:hypothetical protein
MAPPKRNEKAVVGDRVVRACAGLERFSELRRNPLILFARREMPESVNWPVCSAESHDVSGLADYCKSAGVDLTMVGPEDYSPPVLSMSSKSVDCHRRVRKPRGWVARRF